MGRRGYACWLLGLLVACEPGVQEAPPDEAAPKAPQSVADPSHPEPPQEDALRVVLLGTGTPIPDPKRAGPSTAVVVAGQPYLFDAGPGVVRRAEAARRAGISALNPLRLDRLFVTHLHSDHTVGLADVMRSPAVIGRPRPLEVHGPEGTQAMVARLREAYRVDARIRFAVEGDRPGFAVEAHDVAKGVVYRDERVTVTALPVQHGLFEHALGYQIDSGGQRVVISGDTTPTDTVVQACDGCDVLVHEVYCASGLRELDPSVRRYHHEFHTSSHELADLANRARPKLLVLTHLLFFGCSPMQLLSEVRTGYAGEVVLGEDLGVY